MSKPNIIRKPFRIMAAILSIFAIGVAISMFALIDLQSLTFVFMAVNACILAIDCASIAWRGHGMLFYLRHASSRKNGNNTEQETT